MNGSEIDLVFVFCFFGPIQLNIFSFLLFDQHIYIYIYIYIMMKQVLIEPQRWMFD